MVKKFNILVKINIYKKVLERELYNYIELYNQLPWKYPILQYILVVEVSYWIPLKKVDRPLDAALWEFPQRSQDKLI